MQPKIKLEQEVRFRVMDFSPREIFNRLFMITDITGFYLTQISSSSHDAYYFDTPDLRLFKQNKTFRVIRKDEMGNCKYYLTLKSKLDEEISEEKTCPIIQEMFYKMIGGYVSPFAFIDETLCYKDIKPKPSFLRIKRKVLLYEKDKRTIEVSLDNCIGAKDVPMSLFLVLEIENQDAAMEDFRIFYDYIEKSLPIIPTTLSKYQTLVNLQKKGKIQEEIDFNKSSNKGFLTRRLEALKRIYELPVIVLLGGGSSSGKEYIAGNEKITGVSILRLDDYHRGKTYMKQHNIPHYDDPRAVNLDLATEHIDQLKQGETIQKPIYRFREEPEGTETFEPNDIIIVDGIFALLDPIYQKGHYSIFTEANFTARLLRRLYRDVIKGRVDQTMHEVLFRLLTDVEPAYMDIVLPTKNKADLIVINNYQPEQEGNYYATLLIRLFTEKTNCNFPKL